MRGRERPERGTEKKTDMMTKAETREMGRLRIKAHTNGGGGGRDGRDRHTQAITDIDTETEAD